MKSLTEQPHDTAARTRVNAATFTEQEFQQLSTAQREYARFLAEIEPWQTWFTGTFAAPGWTDDSRWRAHPEQALKNFKVYLRECHMRYGEELGLAWKNSKGRWRGPANNAWDRHERPTYVLSCEKNSRNGGVHLHALIRWHPLWPVPWSIYGPAWNHYGWGRIKEIQRLADSTSNPSTPENVRLGTCFYLVKYSVKGDSSPYVGYELHLSEGLSSGETDVSPPGERSERKRPQGAEPSSGPESPLRGEDG